MSTETAVKCFDLYEKCLINEMVTKKFHDMFGYNIQYRYDPCYPVYLGSKDSTRINQEDAIKLASEIVKDVLGLGDLNISYYDLKQNYKDLKQIDLELQKANADLAHEIGDLKHNI